jgi:lipid A disaccharide synthetase
MIVALTANGPGEFAGWVRPLLAALYGRDPTVDVRVFCLPDGYATGREPAYVKHYFPQATVYPSRDYVAFALGRPLAGMPDRVDRVQYLGGDLLHAARLHDRLGGFATAYKFSRKNLAKHFSCVFAIDAANQKQLVGWGIAPETIRIVGNLAIDGALGEASGAFGDPDDERARDGIIMLPGSRKFEIEEMLPMFVRIALQVCRRLPGVPIVFARSPFTTDDELRRSLARGGSREAYGMRAELTPAGDAILAGGERFPLATAAMRAARHARLAIAIPGTKIIELAALGVPALTVMPMNRPEKIVINGVLEYAGRIPLIGTPLKRAAIVAGARRFAYFGQPNIDAGRAVNPEVRGAILPSRIAHLAAALYADTAWRGETSAALTALYAPQAGAAERMARALLEVPA